MKHRKCGENYLMLINASSQ